jgi:SAM-dependent methyltransferase
MELFGQDIPLVRFPRLPCIRGVGMTDQEGYSEILASKFSYTNTFYDREPRLDFSEPHPHLSNTYDFVLSADVFEHVAPPVERAMSEVWRMLKPAGFLAATVPCTPDDQMREHFPELFEYRVVPIGESAVLLNRRRDGVLEVKQDLAFHEGRGATLEMRQFGVTRLRAELLAAGFREVHFLTENLPEIGILFDRDVSQPLIARKAPFLFDRAAQIQLAGEWRAAQDRILEADRLTAQVRMASRSRWLQLGRALGLGPRF